MSECAETLSVSSKRRDGVLGGSEDSPRTLANSHTHLRPAVHTHASELNAMRAMVYDLERKYHDDKRVCVPSLTPLPLSSLADGLERAQTAGRKLEVAGGELAFASPARYVQVVDLVSTWCWAGGGRSEAGKQWVPGSWRRGRSRGEWSAGGGGAPE